MAYIKVAGAAALLLLVVSCAYNQPANSYEMSQLAAKASPAPMDGGRRIARQDCTKPVMADHGNLLCK